MRFRVLVDGHPPGNAHGVNNHSLASPSFEFPRFEPAARDPVLDLFPAYMERKSQRVFRKAVLTHLGICARRDPLQVPAEASASLLAIPSVSSVVSKILRAPQHLPLVVPPVANCGASGGHPAIMRTATALVPPSFALVLFHLLRRHSAETLQPQ
jgi:hypothetical protein